MTKRVERFRRTEAFQRGEVFVRGHLTGSRQFDPGTGQAFLEVEYGAGLRAWRALVPERDVVAMVVDDFYPTPARWAVTLCTLGVDSGPPPLTWCADPPWSGSGRPFGITDDDVAALEPERAADAELRERLEHLASRSPRVCD